jgi:hypothetical protein
MLVLESKIDKSACVISDLAVLESKRKRDESVISDLTNRLLALEAHPVNTHADPQFYPFVIRDSSRRLADIQVDQGVHAYDNLDASQSDQFSSKQHSLYLGGHKLAPAPCQVYGVKCYRLKILQTFRTVLEQSSAD